MDTHEEEVIRELRQWRRKMLKKPTAYDSAAKKIQSKMNSLIPEKVHQAVTFAIKNMIQAVLTGSDISQNVLAKIEQLAVKVRTDAADEGEPIAITAIDREKAFFDELNFYKKTAAATGAGTGAGGILLGLADFPILLGLKMKFLYNVATIYGFDIRDYRERIFILDIFQLTFSSQVKRPEILARIVRFNEYKEEIPQNIKDFDWRTFQQEYRDYIDLAKLLQLVPGIGAFVGAYANYQLMDKLGETARNAYRLRRLKNPYFILDNE